MTKNRNLRTTFSKIDVEKQRLFHTFFYVFHVFPKFFHGQAKGKNM